MPKTKRDQIKRKLAQGYVNIDWAAKSILDVYELFKEPHPELAEGLYLCLKALKDVQTVLDAFAISAWDVDEPKWMIWLGSNRPTHEYIPLSEEAATDEISDNSTNTTDETQS